MRKGKRAASSLKAFVFIFSEKLCSILQNLKGRVNHAVARNCETERFENPSRHLGRLLHACTKCIALVTTEQVFIDQDVGTFNAIPWIAMLRTERNQV